MNARCVQSPRLSRLPLLLVLTQLCLGMLAPGVRGQDAPAAGDQSGNAAAAPTGEAATPESAASSEPPTAPPVYYPRWGAPTTYGEPGLGVIQREPASELGTPQYGVPYSSVVPSNGFDPFSGNGLGGSLTSYPQVGGAEGNLTLGAAGFRVPSLPFISHGFAPENADLKLGPLYFKLDSLTANLLYSDNYRLSTTNRQSEVLAVISLNMTLIAQLTDDLQLSVNGTLLYLPLQNIVGFQSSSLEGSLGFLLSALPLLTSEVTYDAMVAGWPVLFSDRFSSATGSYSDSTRDNFNLFNGAAIQRNDAGQYTFRSGHVNLRSNSSTANSDNSQDNDFSVFANTFSAYTGNYLPDDIWLSARALRTDLWYDQGNSDLPTSQESFTIRAESLRESMRFKPYVEYSIMDTSNVPGVYQLALAGIHGPITDQLFLRAEVGYFFSNNGHQNAIWNLDLHHDAGPYTTEYLNLSRSLSDFNDEVVTTEYYEISQTLGPTLKGSAFGYHSDFQELVEDQSPNRSQDSVGVGVTWLIGPWTTLDARGIFTHQHYDDGFVTDTWTGRLQLSRTITDTLYFTAVYQYQRYNANVANNSYYEDLVFLSLVKYFP